MIKGIIKMVPKSCTEKSVKRADFKNNPALLWGRATFCRGIWARCFIKIEPPLFLSSRLFFLVVEE